MKRIIDTSEVLGTVELPDGRCEVCAAAEAVYDEGSGRLLVTLNAGLRPADLLGKERPVRPDWLPRNELVTETVDLEECRDLARDIFHRWVRKVRNAVPRIHPA
jgi:hypothetical protein